MRPKGNNLTTNKRGMMAQFRGTLKGNRGQASRLGTKNSGLDMTADAWEIGAIVRARHNIDGENLDSIEFSLTAGSHHSNPILPAIYIMADDKGGYVIQLNGRTIINHKPEISE